MEDNFPLIGVGGGFRMTQAHYIYSAFYFYYYYIRSTSDRQAFDPEVGDRSCKALGWSATFSPSCFQLQSTKNHNPGGQRSVREKCLRPKTAKRRRARLGFANISFVGFRVGRELKEETSKCSFQFLGRKDSAKPGLAISVQGCEKIKFCKVVCLLKWV